MYIQKDIITSRANALVKWASSLSDKKGRYENSAFIAEGIKLTLEAASASLPITHCFISEDKEKTYLPLVKEALKSDIYDKTQIIIVSKSVFEKISTEKAPQGVISVVKHLDFFSNMTIIYKEEFFIKEDERAIILCSVRDPSNLGSVIRSSVAFGVQHIILSDDCADIYNPKTIRSAMGSLFKVKVTVVKSLPELIGAMQYNGRRVFCAELRPGAKSLKEIDLRTTDAIIIGNEGHGIPEEISLLCDASVYIPISENTESLNASVAAAVFMWEQSK